MIDHLVRRHRRRMVRLTPAKDRLFEGFARVSNSGRFRGVEEMRAKERFENFRWLNLEREREYRKDSGIVVVCWCRGVCLWEKREGGVLGNKGSLRTMTKPNKKYLPANCNSQPAIQPHHSRLAFPSTTTTSPPPPRTIAVLLFSIPYPAFGSLRGAKFFSSATFWILKRTPFSNLSRATSRE